VGVVLSLLVPPDKAYLCTVGLVVLFHALSGFQPPAEIASPESWSIA
jgi:predicted membrane metal-binding protein